MRSGGTRRKRLLFWGLVVVLLGAASMLLFWPHAPLEPEPNVVPDDVARPRAADRTLQLYFADRGAQGLVAESRTQQFSAALEENVEAVVSALVAGPHEQEHAAMVPAETRLQQTFFSESTHTLFLDFNSAIVTRHPGGSTAEYLTMSCSHSVVSSGKFFSVIFRGSSTALFLVHGHSGRCAIHFQARSSE